MIEVVIPPQQDGGVYDFACLLAAEFRDRNIRLTHLSRTNVCDWQVVPDATIYLQMSAYGFHRRGSPLWLLDEIRRRRGAIRRLGIFFHELYAFGPVWSSSFWLSPVQRHIVRRLAELSDFWVTNRDGSARWLERFAGDRPHAVLPVFSTVGEPADRPSERHSALVVFGKPGLRRSTYLAGGQTLFDWCREQALAIHDIGDAIADPVLQRLLSHHGVVRHGRVDASEVSRLLGEVRYALLAYPVEYVAKSTVFAAACAHGVCPILITPTNVESDGLISGHHYLSGIPSGPMAEDTVKAVGAMAREWYQAHGLARHVAVLRTMTGEGP